MDGETISKVEELERSDPKDPETQFELAQHYFKGSGTKRDYAKALDWYYKAARQGHTGAMFKVGQCLYKGLGTEENRLEALVWYEDAGRSGHSQAAFTAANMYYSGDGVEKDLYEAKAWFEQSREHEGYSILYRINKELGTDLTTKEIRKKMEQMEKEAEEGETLSMLELSRWYIDGKNIKPDPGKARYWAETALQAGSVTANKQMGLICEKEGDLSSAAEWFRKGADKGNADSMYKLGMYYLNGIGVEKDIKKAYELLDDAHNRAGRDFSRYDINQAYWKAKEEYEALTGANKAEEKKDAETTDQEEPAGGSYSSYKEPIWIELLSIAAAILVCVLTVLFIKIGAGKYGNEAEIVVKGFKKLLLEIVCIGGIVGLSAVSLGLASLSLLDVFEFGSFIGGAAGVAAVIFLGVNYAAKKVVFIAAGVVIAGMLIKAIYNQKG